MSTDHYALGQLDGLNESINEWARYARQQEALVRQWRSRAQQQESLAQQWQAYAKRVESIARDYKNQVASLEHEVTKGQDQLTRQGAELEIAEARIGELTDTRQAEVLRHEQQTQQMQAAIKGADIQVLALEMLVQQLVAELGEASDFKNPEYRRQVLGAMMEDLSAGCE